MPFTNSLSRHDEPSYIGFDVPSYDEDPSVYSSDSDYFPSRPTSFISIQSNESLSSTSKTTFFRWKSPRKLIEPFISNIGDALRSSFRTPEKRAQKESGTKKLFLDFESPDQESLEASELAKSEFERIYERSSTPIIRSRKLIVKRKSMNEKSQRNRDVLRRECEIERFDRQKVIDRRFSLSEGRRYLPRISFRQRSNLPKYSDLMPSERENESQMRKSDDMTSPISSSSSPWTKNGFLYRKKNSIRRHRSNVNDFISSPIPNILSSPRKVLNLSMFE